MVVVVFCCCGCWEDFLLELGLVAALGIGVETGRPAVFVQKLSTCLVRWAGLETTDVLSFLEASRYETVGVFVGTRSDENITTLLQDWGSLLSGTPVNTSCLQPHQE